MSGRRDLTCRRLVELVTGYLDGRLDAGTREAVEAHFEHCTDCAVYLAQIEALGPLARSLVADSTGGQVVPPGMLADLLEAFRRRGGS